MKIKTILTALFLIGAIFGAKAQDAAERRAQMDTLLQLGRTECFMIEVDIESYLKKVGTLSNPLKMAYLGGLYKAFPFSKKRLKSVEDLNKLCNDAALRKEFINTAQSVIQDYWKQKAAMIEFNFLSE